MFEEEQNCGTSTSFELKLNLAAGLTACTSQWCNGIAPFSLGFGTYMIEFDRSVVPLDQFHELGLCYTYTPSGGSAKTDCYPIEVAIMQSLSVDFSAQCGLINANNGFTTSLTSTKTNWAVEGWVLEYPFTNLNPDTTLSLTSDWLNSYKSEITDGKFYTFQANIVSTLGEERQLFCEATFTFFSMPEIYIQLSATNLDAVSFQDIVAEVFTKDGDHTKVNEFQYTWTLEVENNGAYVEVTGVTTNDNRVVAEAYLFESGKKYRGCVAAVHTGGQTATTCAFWKMSSQSPGSVSLSQKNNLTTKTKVAITAQNYVNGVANMELECQNSNTGDLKTIRSVADQNTIKKVKLPRSDRYSCWVLITDKSGWEYTATISATVTKAQAAADIQTEITENGLLDTVINADTLQEDFDATEFKTTVKQEIVNLKGSLSGKAKVNGQLQASSVSSVIGEISEYINLFKDDPVEALEVLPLDDLSEIMTWVATDNSASSVSSFAVESVFEMLVTTETSDQSSSSATNLYSSIRQSCSSGCNVKTSNGVLKNERLTVDALQDTATTTVRTSPSTTSGLETIECGIPNSFLKTKGSLTGSAQVSVNAIQRKLSTNSKNAIKGSDTNSVVIEGSVSLELRTASDGLINFDGTASFDIKIDVSNARTLQTVTTTTQTPVCMRYDTASSSWTTNGVTTVDNGSTVTCQTTISGDVTIKIVTTTTTTTTPEASGSSSNIGLIVGLVVGLVVIVVALVLMILFIKKCKKRRAGRRSTRTVNFQGQK